MTLSCRHLWWCSRLVAFGTYWISSITIVFLNKYFLVSTKLNFILLFMQNSTTTLCGILAIFAIVFSTKSHIAKNYPALLRFLAQLLIPPSGEAVFPVITIFTYILSLALNNFCLKEVNVSFFQAIRSIGLVFTVALQFILLGQRDKTTSLLSCCVVICGFWLGVDQESLLGQLTTAGLVFGFAASFAVAFHGVLIKKALERMKIAVEKEFSAVPLHSWKLALLSDLRLLVATNFLSLFPLAVCIYAAGESWQSTSSEDVAFKLAPTIATSGILTFFISISSFACIRLTSPLSHNISGQSKAVLQTALAVWFFGEDKTLLWWTANALVIIGAFAYSVSKMTTIDEKHGTDKNLNLTKAVHHNGNGLNHSDSRKVGSRLYSSLLEDDSQMVV